MIGERLVALSYLGSFLNFFIFIFFCNESKAKGLGSMKFL